jgi:hypothetical protein
MIEKFKASDYIAKYVKEKDLISFHFCEQEIWWQHLLFYVKHEYISMSFSKTADIRHISLIPAVVIMKV